MTHKLRTTALFSNRGRNRVLIICFVDVDADVISDIKCQVFLGVKEFHTAGQITCHQQQPMGTRLGLRVLHVFGRAAAAGTNTKLCPNKGTITNTKSLPSDPRSTPRCIAL
jgi:hypothetical protein